MSEYVLIRSFRGDWNNKRMGRKVQCPRCGHSFRAYVRINDAICGCGAQMKVLTAKPEASSSLSAVANSSREARLGPQKSKGVPSPYTRPGIDEGILSCGQNGASSRKDAQDLGKGGREHG